MNCGGLRHPLLLDRGGYLRSNGPPGRRVLGTRRADQRSPGRDITVSYVSGCASKSHFVPSDATLCLTTALSHHDLTDVIPSEIDVALPDAAFRLWVLGAQDSGGHSLQSFVLALGGFTKPLEAFARDKPLGFQLDPQIESMANAAPAQLRQR